MPHDKAHFPNLLTTIIAQYEAMKKAQGRLVNELIKGADPSMVRVNPDGSRTLTVATYPAGSPLGNLLESQEALASTIEQLVKAANGELPDIEQMIDEYAELRHSHGAPSYNAKVQQARRAITAKLLSLSNVDNRSQP